MDDLRKAHNPYASNGTISAINGNGVSYENGTKCSGLADKRLSLYGYNLETINMLLIPMIQNK